MQSFLRLAGGGDSPIAQRPLREQGKVNDRRWGEADFSLMHRWPLWLIQQLKMGQKEKQRRQPSSSAPAMWLEADGERFFPAVIPFICAGPGPYLGCTAHKRLGNCSLPWNYILLTDYPISTYCLLTTQSQYTARWLLCNYIVPYPASACCSLTALWLNSAHLLPYKHILLPLAFVSIFLDILL